MRKPSEASLATLTNITNALEEIIQDVKKAKEAQDLSTEDDFVPRYKARANEDNNVPGHLVAVSYLDYLETALLRMEKREKETNCSELRGKSSRISRDQ